VPMMVAGDECRRTQQGNNNVWCQDNAVSWFDWDLVTDHADLVRFVSALIRLRLDNPTLRRRTFLEGGSSGSGLLPDVEWFSPEGHHIDWYAADGSLTCFFSARFFVRRVASLPGFLQMPVVLILGLWCAVSVARARGEPPCPPPFSSHGTARAGWKSASCFHRSPAMPTGSVWSAACMPMCPTTSRR